MLKYELCRICMKRKKPNTKFLKIFESKAMGDLVANILIDFANVYVDESDGLPHIICNNCFDSLIKCREFQKLVVQNDSTLSNLAENSPAEIQKMIAEPLVRIEKVKKCEEPFLVTLDITEEDPEDVSMVSSMPAETDSSSEDEDDIPIEDDVLEMVPPVPASPRFNCCSCPLHFDEEYELIGHMKTVHTEIRTKLNIVPVDKDPADVKQCELCFKYFVGTNRLIEHQSMFVDCKQCAECGRFYQKKGKLGCPCKRQEEPITSETKKLQLAKVRCDICSNMVRHLSSHKTMMHSERILTCKQCDFTTQIKNKMLRHVANHLAKTFPCSFPGCNKLFISSDCPAFKLHLARHKGEKKFVCKYCGKVFTDNSDCKRHEWQHAGVSPYMCSKCNKMFLRKSHLLAHEDKC